MKAQDILVVILGTPSVLLASVAVVAPLVYSFLAVS
jgi:hypothetical protein